jgi:hypothetical protein
LVQVTPLPEPPSADAVPARTPSAANATTTRTASRFLTLVPFLVSPGPVAGMRERLVPR